MFKFKVGDPIIVTSGKHKGQTGQISQVVPERDQVVVAGVNTYTRHIRKVADQAGQKITRERPLSVAKIAILNDKKQPDRIGFSLDKKGLKTRIFKKTGQLVPEPKKTDKK